MRETHDTVDGLLAEFRGYSAGMPPSYHVTMSWADFRKMLDRFDAANKREVQNALDAGGFVEASRKNKQVGDAAKLREALKATLDLLWDIHNANRSPQSNQAYAVIRQIKAALAAPPRNCDRFGGDIDKLREACARERGLNPEEDFPDVFPDWLLALAQKGVAK